MPHPVVPTHRLDHDRAPVDPPSPARATLVEALVEALVAVEGGTSLCVVDLQCVNRKCMVEG